MSTQITNYQCPACTGPLRYDGQSGKLQCDYCESSFTVEEIEAAFAHKNDAAACDLKKDKILLNAEVIDSESSDIPIIYYPIGTASGSNPIISPVALIFT